jgi:hypothetical protein
LLGYSVVSNIGDLWSPEEATDESLVLLDIEEIGLDIVLGALRWSRLEPTGNYMRQGHDKNRPALFAGQVPR